MNGYLANIEQITLQNPHFRQVLFTGQHCQLVVMTLKPGEEIGLETHSDVDQFFRIEQGQARVIIDGKEALAQDNFAIIVPAGSKHNIINASASAELKLYTLYSPPNHPAGTIHATKAEAEAAHHD